LKSGARPSNLVGLARALGELDRAGGLCGCWSFVHGQRDPKARALPQLARHPDAATVRLDQVLDDGETKAGAAEIARAPLVHPVEALEHTTEVLLRDSGPIVFHAQLHHTRLTLGRDADGVIISSVLDGV